MPIGVLVMVPPLSAPGEHVLEHVGAIGDQAVDAEVEQLVHLRRLVDGPDVDVGAGGVGAAYERPGDDRERSAAVGDLQGGDPVAGEPPREPPRGAGQEDGDLRGGGRGGDAAARWRRGRRRAATWRTSPRRSGRGCAVRSMSSASAGTAPSDFRSMLKRQRREGLEQLGHGGHGVLGADPGCRDLLGVEVGEAAPGVGDPVERVVVEGQQDSVERGVHVGLEVVVAERHGVLGRRAGCSRRPAGPGAARRRGGPSRPPSRAGRARRRGRAGR